MFTLLLDKNPICVIPFNNKIIITEKTMLITFSDVIVIARDTILTKIAPHRNSKRLLFSTTTTMSLRTLLQHICFVFLFNTYSMNLSPNITHTP